MSNSTRIAKNTIMLYFRQIMIMLVTLYTVRLVLNILGVEDYGIYNIVNSLAVIFWFLNAAMTSATQRFLNFAMGQNDMEQVRNIFSISFILHIFIAILFVFLAETVGLWLFYTWLNIPPDRQNAAFVVYQFSIVTMAIGILQIPYRATIIAYEKMSFFALGSVIEVLLRLGAAFLLVIILFDKLIIYAVLCSFTGLIIFFLYKLYCNRTFETARFRYCKDKKLFHQLAEFSGWTAFSGFAGACSSRGVDVFVNIFYGVTVNAAMGIAGQVNAAVYSIITSFQTAFNPQIIKSYSAKDYDYFKRLLFQTSKISFYLLLFFVLPLYINAEFVLKLWLKNVPEYTVVFTQLILLRSLVSPIGGPLATSINATGNIKKFQIIGSFIWFLNLPLSFIFLWLGFSPVWVLMTGLLLNIIVLFWRIFFICKRIDVLVLEFLYKVIAPIVVIAGISGLVTVFFQSFFIDWSKLILSCIVSTICTGCLVYFIGLNRQEKVLLQNKIQAILKL